MMKGERVVSHDRGGWDKGVTGPPEGDSDALRYPRSSGVSAGRPQPHFCMEVSGPRQPLCWPGRYGVRRTRAQLRRAVCRVRDRSFGPASACSLGGSEAGFRFWGREPRGQAAASRARGPRVPRSSVDLQAPEAAPGGGESGPGGPAPCPGPFLPPADPVLT